VLVLDRSENETGLAAEVEVGVLTIAGLDGTAVESESEYECEYECEYDYDYGYEHDKTGRWRVD